MKFSSISFVKVLATMISPNYFPAAISGGWDFLSLVEDGKLTLSIG